MVITKKDIKDRLCSSKSFTQDSWNDYFQIYCMYSTMNMKFYSSYNCLYFFTIFYSIKCCLHNSIANPFHFLHHLFFLLFLQVAKTIVQSMIYLIQTMDGHFFIMLHIQVMLKHVSLY
jgi:hypothetical protein